MCQTRLLTRRRISPISLIISNRLGPGSRSGRREVWRTWTACFKTRNSLTATSRRLIPQVKCCLPYMACLKTYVHLFLTPHTIDFVHCLLLQCVMYVVTNTHSRVVVLRFLSQRWSPLAVYSSAPPRLSSRKNLSHGTSQKFRLGVEPRVIRAA